MRFFRKIREKLLSDGKTVRYLKYAIGEIVLVVIGILIALSINNWNQDRVLHQLEIKLYQNIKRQLVEDINVINNNIDFNQYFYDQYQYAKELIEKNDREHQDTLAIICINLLEYSDFHQETNAYESLNNSGEIKILNNQEIIEGLQRLEEIYIYINRLENSHFEIIKMIYPELSKIIRLNSPKIEDEASLFSYEFQNHIVIISEIMREKDDIYRRALDEINSILDLIDKEVEEND